MTPVPLLSGFAALIAAAAPSFAQVNTSLPAEQPVLPGDPAPLDPPPVKKFVHNRDSIPDRPPVILLTDGVMQWTTRSGLDDGPGSSRVERSDLLLNLVVGPEHDFQFSLPVDFENSSYHFRGVTGLLPDGGDGFRHAYQIAIVPNIDAKVTDRWSIIGGAIAIFGGQYGVDAEDSGTYGGFGGVKYRFSDNLKVSLALSGVTQILDNPVILPLPGIEWKINDRTRLVSEGPELRFEYDINEAWTVKLVGGYESRAFRLDKDASVPRGVLRDDRVPLTVNLEFTPHAAVRFEGWAGITAYQEYRVDDRFGHRIGEDNSGLAPTFGAQFEIIF